MAIKSLLTVREDVTEDQARDAVDAVFDKCYGDKEPFGRFFVNVKKDPQISLNENKQYGYDKQYDHDTEVITDDW